MARPSRIELALWRQAIGASRYVTERPQFALNEAFLRKRTRQYTLKRGGRKLVVRHPLVDAYILTEVLGGTYDPPPEVIAALPDDRALRIGELGGHIGSATLALADRFPDASLTVFEAHPDNARILTAAVHANGLEDRVFIRPQAAGAGPGQMTMEGYSALAHHARDEVEILDAMPFIKSALGPPTSVTVDVVDVFPALAECDLLKIDIEGGEWPILSDERFARLQARGLVMEYHRWGAPSTDAAQAASELLTRAGFRVGKPFDVRPDVGMLWAWKPRDGAQTA